MMSLLDGAKLTEVKPKMSEAKITAFAKMAWTFPETKDIKSDPRLEGAFESIIDAIVNGCFDDASYYKRWLEEFE